MGQIDRLPVTPADLQEFLARKNPEDLTWDMKQQLVVQSIFPILLTELDVEASDQSARQNLRFAAGAIIGFDVGIVVDNRKCGRDSIEERVRFQRIDNPDGTWEAYLNLDGDLFINAISCEDWDALKNRLGVVLSEIAREMTGCGSDMNFVPFYETWRRYEGTEQKWPLV